MTHPPQSEVDAALHTIEGQCPASVRVVREEIRRLRQECAEKDKAIEHEWKVKVAALERDYNRCFEALRKEQAERDALKAEVEFKSQALIARDGVVGDYCRRTLAAESALSEANKRLAAMTEIGKLFGHSKETWRPEQLVMYVTTALDRMRGMTEVLMWLDRLGGLGYEAHERIKTALAALPQPQAQAQEPCQKCDDGIAPDGEACPNYGPSCHQTPRVQRERPFCRDYRHKRHGLWDCPECPPQSQDATTEGQ